jgi:hypothetical protein
VGIEGNRLGERRHSLLHFAEIHPGLTQVMISIWQVIGGNAMLNGFVKFHDSEGKVAAFYGGLAALEMLIPVGLLAFFE